MEVRCPGLKTVRWLTRNLNYTQKCSRERFECYRRRFCRQGADRSPTPSLLPSPADRGVDRLATMLQIGSAQFVKPFVKSNGMTSLRDTAACIIISPGINC